MHCTPARPRGQPLLHPQAAENAGIVVYFSHILSLDLWPGGGGSQDASCLRIQRSGRIIDSCLSYMAVYCHMGTGQTLQQKRVEATREHILAVAFDLLVNRPDQSFSHEAVARAAGVGARTVYRYFPAQADFYEALWLKVREQSGTIFPTQEAEIIPHIGVLYRAFDRNEKLIRAVMESAAGARVRAGGAEEGRVSFEKSLQRLLQGRSAVERRQIRAVFQGIHSGPFWQMLHDRGGLSSDEAIGAASWAVDSLLDTLRRKQKKRSNIPSKNERKRGQLK